jgi:lipopolysaccharide transport system ATP-binding protein
MSAEPVIRVEGLSKVYRIVPGRTSGRAGLRESLSAAGEAFWSRLRHGAVGERAKEVEFWALRDVSFEVAQGEIVGIIGRNGAGKSTLLKILSRITEPTSGRATLEGRVASLLEVGTGFQQDLTGRENVFLNGAILGMRRAEILKKFDEIVAFSEVEQFIDTPVKRYSSGMYMRLAFAVAAHLEPEILVVDEVLAVGDAQFQKKCLGKMKDVSGQGRTVLFVSHNMEAILKLCSHALLLASGSVVSVGDVNKVVASYLEGHLSSMTFVDLREISRPLGSTGRARFVGVLPAGDKQSWSFAFGKRLALEIHVQAQAAMDNIELGVALLSARGFEVASWTSTYSSTKLPLKPGLNILRVEYANLALLPGQYVFALGLRSDRGFEDYIPEAVWFEIVVSESSAEVNAHTFCGVIVPTVNAEVLV